MQKIDFIKGIGYEVISFPDGEKHLKINKLDRKDTVGIICRITNSDDLFLLMQLSDVLNRQCVVVDELVITYLMTMRCDRLFSLEQPFSLGIIANVVNSFNANSVTIIEPHSDVSLKLIKNSEAFFGMVRAKDEDFIYCFPDKGSSLRYKEPRNRKPIICSKVRDKNTGALVEFKLEDLGDYKTGMNIFVVDDLCDGGGTFLGVEKVLRALRPNAIMLGVTHAIQKAGIEKVARVYDKVLITNSYKSWEKEDLPENVDVIDLFLKPCIE